MIARELAENAWFRRSGDWRVWRRLPGPIRIIEGQEGVLVRPIQPTVNQPDGYIPAEDEVKLFQEKSIRLA